MLRKGEHVAFQHILYITIYTPYIVETYSIYIYIIKVYVAEE